MKVGDMVKSKSTGKIFRVVEKKPNRDGFYCEPENSSERFYFFPDEVEVINDKFFNDTKETEKTADLRSII